MVTMSGGRSWGHSDLSRFKSELLHPDCGSVGPVDGARLLYAARGGGSRPLAWLRWPARVPARRLDARACLSG